MQQFLKPAAGRARARIVAAQFFDEILVAVYYAISALDAGLRRESLATLTPRSKRVPRDSARDTDLEGYSDVLRT
jgi:hypothetical protein